MGPVQSTGPVLAHRSIAQHGFRLNFLLLKEIVGVEVKATPHDDAALQTGFVAQRDHFHGQPLRMWAQSTDSCLSLRS